MAEYLGMVKLGALYKQGTPLVRPSKPWRTDGNFAGEGHGNTPSMEGGLSNYTLGNTPSDEGKKLKWHKIKDGNKTLLICDRNILVNVSWDDLNNLGYVTGKNVVIDGTTYKARLLTGGNYYRNGSNYAGGEPSNNEWDRFITNEDNIHGLVKPKSSDLDSSADYTDKQGEHNQEWNWGYIYSWGQELYAINVSHRTIRGYHSARCHGSSTSNRYPYIGWRPVLEAPNAAPLVSDTDRNLGDKTSNFSIPYTVNDSDANDVLTITEKVDSTTLRTIQNAVRGQSYTLNVDVSSLALTSHIAKIEVTDGKSGVTTRTFAFRKTNTAPGISGSDENLGVITEPFSRNYTVTDNENNAVTITEKINSETIRTFQATLGKQETITLPEEVFRKLENGTHTLKIEASDSNAATTIRSFSFEKNDKNVVIELKAIETDKAVSKVTFTPFFKHEGGSIKVEVSNNAFDESPVWENMTNEAMINKLYKVKNKSKTAERWGLSFRIMLTRWEGYSEEISVTGFGGAFE